MRDDIPYIPTGRLLLTAFHLANSKFGNLEKKKRKLLCTKVVHIERDGKMYNRINVNFQSDIIGVHTHILSAYSPNML